MTRRRTSWPRRRLMALGGAFLITGVLSLGAVIAFAIAEAGIAFDIAVVTMLASFTAAAALIEKANIRWR